MKRLAVLLIFISGPAWAQPSEWAQLVLAQAEAQNLRTTALRLIDRIAELEKLCGDPCKPKDTK